MHNHLHLPKRCRVSFPRLARAPASTRWSEVDEIGKEEAMRRILYALVALLALNGPVFAQAGGGAAGTGAAGGQSNTNAKGTPGEAASGSNIPSGQGTMGTTTVHRRTHRHYARHRAPSRTTGGRSTTIAPSTGSDGTNSGGTSQQ